MNPEWKTLWTAALRSGTYSQGHHTLKGTSGYCCLGVLAHLAAEHIQAEGGDWRVNEDDACMTVEADAKPSQTILPPALQEYFGLDSDTMFVLTGMNDGGMNDFNEIANYIESRL
jgi:hypothetical protein